MLGDEIIAVGRYERAPDTDEAEVAFVVADAHQGRGIGSVLLEHLAAAGRERGVKRFNAVVLAENSAMVRVFRDAGYETKRHLEHGEVTLEFAIDETAMTEAVMREREQRAEARSIQRLLYPRSVAVVGASNEAGQDRPRACSRICCAAASTGRSTRSTPRRGMSAACLRTARCSTSPARSTSSSSPCRPRPSSTSSHECASRGVRGLVVLSGGFGERGDDDERAGGRARAARARRRGARERHARRRAELPRHHQHRRRPCALNASLAPFPPLAGRAGFFASPARSASRCSARRRAAASGCRRSCRRATAPTCRATTCCSSGRPTSAPTSSLMYLESFGNPRKFARLARRLGAGSRSSR